MMNFNSVFMLKELQGVKILKKYGGKFFLKEIPNFFDNSTLLSNFDLRYFWALV
jgi:hypothetical protein